MILAVKPAVWRAFCSLNMWYGLCQSVRTVVEYCWCPQESEHRAKENEIQVLICGVYQISGAISFDIKFKSRQTALRDFSLLLVIPQKFM